MNDVINILKTNTNSINIKNDYINIEKINLYYPNYRILRTMGKILNLISSKNQGSFLLEGAYGTGKSYFTAILLNILSGNYNSLNYQNFLKKSEKIYNIEPELIKFEEKKYFIVFINDLMGEFSKDLSLALYQAAKREKINLNLSSDFEIIEKRIEYWKKNYNETYIKFIEKLEKIIPRDKFFSLLSEKDEKMINIFKTIYSELFSGEKYLSLEKIKHLDELLFEVEKQVKELGYEGIVYTFDEFGRYLESNIEKLDVKEIQDMAEYCNGNNNSNFLIITHKDIFYYGKKKRVKENYDEWSKVSGRFLKEVFLYEKFNTLEILQNILQKNNFLEYKKLHRKEFSLKESLMKELGLEQVDKNIETYYPLDYFTALILPNFSQKFAQNERTLFSFICGEETNSLKFILSENKERFIGLNRIYDYFENSFKELNYEDSTYKLYLQSKNILSLLEKEDEILKVFIKTITIIYIYNNFSEIEPTPKMLSYLLNVENIEKIVEKLKEKNYIQYQKYNNYYKLVEDFDINIDSEINTYISTKLNNFKFMETFNRVVEKEYYYPLKYNDKKKIHRYFGIYYLDVSEIKNINEILENKQEDGKIVYLINILENENYLKIKNNLITNDFILISNKIGKSLDILETLKILEAIRRIKNDDVRYNKNNVFKLELNAYEEEAIEKARNELEVYFQKKDILIEYQDKEYANLLEGTDEYLENKYKNYFVINYELINKHNLTSQMRKARLDILEKILKSKITEKDYFKKTTAESSVARILLKNTNAFENFNLNIEGSVYNEIFQNIISIIKQDKISVGKLYDIFCSNRGSYGIRRGIFTFILGLVLIENIEELSITLKDSNTEILNEISILDKLEKEPEKYEISYFPITYEQNHYLESMEEFFNLYIQSKDEKSYNRVLVGIKNYLLSKPRFMSEIYLKEFRALNKIFKGIFGINNAREFILTFIPKVYENTNYQEVFDNFQNDIRSFDGKEKEFIEELKKDIFLILGYKCSNFKECITLIKNKDKIKEIENSILQLEGMLEKNILIKFTEKLKGFSYENWRNLDEKEEFLKILKEKNIEHQNVKVNENSVRILIGDKEREIFLQMESSMGKILKLKLESVIKNIGTAVSEEERKNILLKLLLEL